MWKSNRERPDDPRATELETRRLARDEYDRPRYGSARADLGTPRSPAAHRGGPPQSMPGFPRPHASGPQPQDERPRIDQVRVHELMTRRVASVHPATTVERAARFLGAPFMLEGEVVGGDRRGRDLGFPTANIVPADHLAHPGHGVYAAWAHGHMAAVNVGVRPTFETGRGLLVEAYLIDFDADLYGETLRIAFARRLRGERRFESAEALVEQMERDVQDARRVLVG